MPTKTNVFTYGILSQKTLDFSKKAELVFLYFQAIGYSERLMRKWAAMYWAATEGKVEGQHQAVTMGLSLHAYRELKKELVKAGLAYRKKGKNKIYLYSVPQLVRAINRHEQRRAAEEAMRAAGDTPEAIKFTSQVVGKGVAQLAFA